MEEDRPTEQSGDSDVTETRSPSNDTARRIGPYVLLQKIGEGGMGEVFLAEQQEPVRRKVALKVIKPGMDSAQVVARFEAERQALALMDHPCVAKVFDAGTTPRGRPYFVMEYVRGVPITEHCDRHRLSNRDRLELFRQVCDGVQHAHHKAIIHRDLKPSNVLVTQEGETRTPKIIDFGVAKATAQRLTERTVYTELGVLIGTPEYMSPEQAEMTAEDVDTRTDVYSLGVMLYELLTGALPFDSHDLRSAGFEGIRRKIREDEPSRPSIRVLTLGDSVEDSARRRRTDVTTLRRQLRGDLDCITMRALEKDPARRYATPLEMAMDIQRHLRNEPVIASPPSATYRLQKFVKRHRVGVGAGVMVAVALLLGIVGTTLGLVRATRAEKESREEAAASKLVADFLVELFEVADPSEARANALTARELLDAGADRIESELASQPLVQARLMTTMGNAYRALGLHSEALRLLEHALTLRTDVLGPDHVEVAAVQHDLGILRNAMGQYEDARTLLENALAVRERVLGPNQPEVAATLTHLGNTLRHSGDLRAAAPLFERALAIYEQTVGPDHPVVASTLNNFANLLADTGEYDRARSLYERALAIRERTLGPEHIEVATGLNNLATLLASTGEYREARALQERAVQIFEQTLGPEHPKIGRTLNNLGMCIFDSGDYDGARPYFERALSITEAALGSTHREVAVPLNNLGNVYYEIGDYSTAKRFHTRALGIREDALGKKHPDVATSLNNLGRALSKSGEHAEAHRLYLRALAIQEELFGREHPEVATTLINLGTMLYDTGDYVEAQPHLERALKIDEKTLGADHPYVAEDLHTLANLYRDMGHYERSNTFYERAQAIYEAKLGTDHPDVATNLEEHAALLRKTGEEDRARDLESRARAIQGARNR